MSSALAWALAAAAVGAAGGGAAGGLSLWLPAAAAPTARMLRRVALTAAAGAALGLWDAWVHPGADAVAGAALGSGLLLVTWLDAEHFWLPDRVTLPLGVAGLGWAALNGLGAFIHAALGAAAGFALLWAVAALYRKVRGREGLGGGDPRLLGAGGAWVGAAALPLVLLIASVSGLAAAGLAALAGRRLSAQTRLPFGCFLALGVWLAWLYAPAIS